MKIKPFGYSVLSLALVCIFFQLALHQQHRPKPQQHIQSETKNEIMVAPALIDSLSDITKIPTLQSGLITHIQVVVGQKVKKGETLFTLANEAVENNVTIQQIRVEQAKNELVIQKKHLKHIKKQLARIQRIDKRAISQAELQEKRYEVNLGVIQLTQAQHQVSLALAQLQNAELALRQHRIVAPKDGVVLQINAHINEFVSGAQTIILLGDAKKIIVRVSLDERDIQRFHPKAHAYLTSNQNSELNIPLTFIQLDQYIITQERLNSRVREALYYFKRTDYPNVVAGQQFDANISLRRDT